MIIQNQCILLKGLYTICMYPIPMHVQFLVGSLAIILSRVSSGFDQYAGTEIAAQGIA